MLPAGITTTVTMYSTDAIAKKKVAARVMRSVVAGAGTMRVGITGTGAIMRAAIARVAAITRAAIASNTATIAVTGATHAAITLTGPMPTGIIPAAITATTAAIGTMVIAGTITITTSTTFAGRCRIGTGVGGADGGTPMVLGHAGVFSLAASISGSACLNGALTSTKQGSVRSFPSNAPSACRASPRFGNPDGRTYQAPVSFLNPAFQSPAPPSNVAASSLAAASASLALPVN